MNVWKMKKSIARLIFSGGYIRWSVACGLCGERHYYSYWSEPNLDTWRESMEKDEPVRHFCYTQTTDEHAAMNEVEFDKGQVRALLVKLKMLGMKV